MTADPKGCPACGFSDAEVVLANDTRVPHHLDEVRPFEALLACRRCGFAYRSPLLRNTDVAQFYARNPYWPSGAITSNVYYRLMARDRCRLAAQYTRARCVLEIGAFNGSFLAAWRSLEPQAELFATETDPQCVEHLRSAGVHTERDAAAFDRKFELVCLFHVLEHYPDPIAFLRPIVRDFLVPGGHLFVEVPHRDYQRKNLMSRVAHHTSFFSPESFVRIAESLELNVEVCAPYGADRRLLRSLLTKPPTSLLLGACSAAERRVLGRTFLQPWLTYHRYRFARASENGTVLRVVLRKQRVDSEEP